RAALLAVLAAVTAVIPPPSAAVRGQPFPPLAPPGFPTTAEPPLVEEGRPVAAPGFAPQPVDPPTPYVVLRVRAPASAPPGQEIDYRILVDNPSRAAAHHVLVRAPVPAN